MNNIIGFYPSNCLEISTDIIYDVISRYKVQKIFYRNPKLCVM